MPLKWHLQKNNTWDFRVGMSSWIRMEINKSLLARKLLCEHKKQWAGERYFTWALENCILYIKRRRHTQTFLLHVYFAHTNSFIFLGWAASETGVKPVLGVHYITTLLGKWLVNDLSFSKKKYIYIYILFNHKCLSCCSSAIHMCGFMHYIFTLERSRVVSSSPVYFGSKR